MAPDSVLEAVVLLYRATDEARYKQFAEYIVRHYDAPGGPAILASLEKTGSVRKVANAKAYEMTSNFNGLLELYRVTGDKRLLDDMRTAWKDIVANRLYITGSASSFEHFQDEFQPAQRAKRQHLRNLRDSDVGTDESGTAAPDRGSAVCRPTGKVRLQSSAWGAKADRGRLGVLHAA